MFNQISKIAGVGFATTFALALSANNAQALDFDFSGFTAGVHSAQGTFRINDSTTPGNITASDFEDWKITLINGDGGANFTLYGPGNSFGTPNSSFVSSFDNKATFDSSSLSFTSRWIIGENGNISSNYFGQNDGVRPNNIAVNFEQLLGGTGRSSSFSGYLTASAAATPVPFGVSPDLSIIILGGLYGAFHLRKKLAASK